MQLATPAARRRSSAAARGASFTGGFGKRRSRSPARGPEHTGYLMDGTNIADISDKAPSSVAGVLLGVDTVQEFSVQTHGYSAEFGRAAGGIISAVTKSGTNQLPRHGFEFHRNSALDARNSFDAGDPPGFLRNQFGGTLGGPILRNRLFFFGGYEGLRDERRSTRIARLPNAQRTRASLPDAAGVLRRSASTPPSGRTSICSFPLPTARTSATARPNCAHAIWTRPTRTSGVGKIDWQRSARTTRSCSAVSRDRSDDRRSQEHPLFVERTGTEHPLHHGAAPAPLQRRTC